MEVDEGSGTPLEKQRRFLILMSLALFGCYALGVNVRAEGEYSGFMVKLTHPERALFGLWVVWGWAVLRYVQRAYELLSVLGTDILEDVYAEDRRLALKKAMRLAKRMAQSGEIGDGRPNVRVTSVSIETGGRKLRFARGNDEAKEVETERHPDYTPTKEGGRKYGGLGGTYSWRDSDVDPGVSTFTFQMLWTAWQVRRHRAHAWIQGVIRLPAVTEHVAPVLIAIIAAASPALFSRVPTQSPAAVSIEQEGSKAMENKRAAETPVQKSRQPWPADPNR